MDDLKIKIEKILELIGFRNFSVSIEPLTRRVSVTLPDPWVKDHLPDMVSSFNALLKIIGKKFGDEPIIFDINGYRKERENIIIDLAKTAARKVASTREPIQLPAMNAYERRLVHAELSMRPDVKTESVGEGKGRYIVIKLAD